MSGSEQAGEVAAVPAELANLQPNANPQEVCAELARLFHVQPNEVALLRLEKGTLKFLFPTPLSSAGTIPLSSPAVAARTAATRSSMLSNNFVKVRHMAIFEAVKARTAENSGPSEPAPIQKLMSVPVRDEKGKVLGVIQISRKGLAPSSAGPDFTNEDLRQLERAAAIAAKMNFLL